MATKGAVRQLTRSIALDFASDNIRANSVLPGAIETNRLLERTPTMEQVREKMVPMHPIGRLGQPEDVANTAVFLASDQSSFMTGSDVFVDGGFTAI
jgi:NAD(P)-dependent dehydrogenase (short-subunit alcohol dehydrogenase family)